MMPKDVIHTIQSYLSSMNWAQQEYKGELLQAYMKGVRDALMQDGIVLQLFKTADVSYESTYRVEVYKYDNPSDCWSEKKTCNYYL